MCLFINLFGIQPNHYSAQLYHKQYSLQLLTFFQTTITGGDRWEDRSWNNKDYADGSREWDNSSSNNRYRDRSYEDEYEAEKEESDTESNHNSYNNSRKFRDAENNDSPTGSEKRVNVTLNAPVSKSPAKNSKPLKKVDLGAAATFGRSGTQSPTPQVRNDLLNDDFNPREGDLNNGRSVSEFGDFETAFGGAVSKKEEADDFADFSSAFSASPAVQQPNQQIFSAGQPNFLAATLPNVLNSTPNVVQPALIGVAPAAPQPSLIGGLQPNLFAAPPSNLFAAAPPTIAGPPQSSVSGNDLLGGLSLLSIQPQINFGAVPNAGPMGSGSLLDGFDSGG